MEQENIFQPTFKVLPPTEKSKEFSLLKSDEEKSIKKNENIYLKIQKTYLKKTYIYF